VRGQSKGASVAGVKQRWRREPPILGSPLVTRTTEQRHRRRTERRGPRFAGGRAVRTGRALAWIDLTVAVATDALGEHASPRRRHLLSLAKE